MARSPPEQPGHVSVGLGSASFQVQASSRAGVEVFISLMDWGLRAHAFSAPFRLHVEPRVLDRQALIAAAQGNDQVLSRTASDFARDGRRAIERAIRFVALGVLIAALVGWALLRIFHCRNRRLLIAVPLGTVAIALVIAGGVLWRVSTTWKTDSLSHPTYYARGTELIQLLDAADHASRIKDSYASPVAGASIP